ncbi:MAG: sigma-54-dependent transcriptional regulator [Opitutales bacterium]
MTAPDTKPTILVIDDDSDLRYSLKRVLAGRGYHVLEAGSGEEGLATAEKDPPHVVLLDNRMGGISGIETLQHLRSVNPNAMILLMTAYGTTQTTIEAMKFGAFDYIVKPFDLKKIVTLTESALAACKDLDEAGRTQKPQSVSEEEVEGGIIGNSSAMQTVFKMIGQVAASDVTVMITGESGTGKELVARAIFRNSLRANDPYIAVNCAAIPENLIESELFGHEKGAFTGATEQRIGKFEQCHKGTIFLDEIGDMALSTQTKILRTLQEGEIQRVGGSQPIRVDVRMLAATNKPLEEMVREKTFREDLYYRLNVVRIQLPPLRERLEDVPPLVEFVLQRLARKSKAPAKTISAEALALLKQYEWPGNVRELENTVYRSAVMAQSDTILPKDLPKEITPASDGSGRPDKDPSLSMQTESDKATGEDTAGPTQDEADEAQEGSLVGAPVEDPFDAVYRKIRAGGKQNILEPIEREIIIRALQETRGKQVDAARILGMTRATLRKRIERYDIQL